MAKLIVPDQSEVRAEFNAFNARSVVYFVTAWRRSDGPIKIGRSTRKALLRRFSQIQVSMADRINALFVFDASAQDETDLHEMFADARVSGEWFRRSPGLMELLNEMISLEPWWREDFGVGPRWSTPPLITRAKLMKFPPAERPQFVRVV